MFRALPGVFLGYPFSQKGYKILDLQTCQVIVSRDVKFSETNFPFSHSAPMSRLFPAIFISTQISYIFPLQQDVISNSETLTNDTKKTYLTQFFQIIVSFQGWNQVQYKFNADLPDNTMLLLIFLQYL